MAAMTALPPRHAFGPSAQEQADLREHAAFAATQDPVALAAATWFSRRGNLDVQQQADFAAWLAADAQHAQAYAQLKDTHRAARKIPALVAARWAVPAPSPRRPLLRSLRVLPYAAAAMLLLSVAEGGYQWWQQQPTFSQSYATARGQRLAVALPDGSSMQLDTATQLHVTLYRQRREVRLAHGEALFQVQAKQGQPFNVLSGPLTVTVVGTQFSVRNTVAHDGKLRVAVQHGQVRVAGARQDLVDLRAGQGVSSDAGGRLSAIASLAPGSVAPWRDGRVTFGQRAAGRGAGRVRTLWRHGPGRARSRRGQAAHRRQLQPDPARPLRRRPAAAAARTRRTRWCRQRDPHGGKNACTSPCDAAA